MAPPANSNGTDRRNQIRPRQFMAVVRASGAARQRGVETSGIQNDGRYRTGDFRPSGESDHVEVRFAIVTRSDPLSGARAGGQCGCPYARLSSTDDRGGDRWIELDIVQDCGHLSTMERPDAVTEALRAWIAR